MGLSLADSKAGTAVAAQRLLPSVERPGVKADLRAVGYRVGLVSAAGKEKARITGA